MKNNAKRVRATMMPLERRWLFAAPAGPLPMGFTTTPFLVGALLADTTRNRVYVADLTNDAIRVIDTDQARQIASIPLVAAPNQLAMTPDGGSLLVTLESYESGTGTPNNDRVQVLSPTTLTSVRVVDTNVVFRSIAAGVGGKFYGVIQATEYPYGTTIRQFDLTTGTAGASMSSKLNGESLLADPTGTHVYAREAGLETIERFDVSKPAALPAGPAEIRADGGNGRDFYVDAARLYTADRSTPGLGSTRLDTGARAHWLFDGADRGFTGVASYPASPSVYASSYEQIVQFRQSDGASQYRYDLSSRDPRAESVVVTPNGRLMYTSDSTFGTSVGTLGIIGSSTLSLDDGEAAVVGTLFNDVNGNGKRDSSETHGLLATVYLDLNGNGQYDDVNDEQRDLEPAFTMNDSSDGAFKIQVPAGVSGTYAVRVYDENQAGSVQPGIVFSTPAFASVTVSGGNQVGGVVIGGTYGGFIVGRAFFDNDGDGKRGEGDEDAAVGYYLDLNDNNHIDVGEPTASVNAGEYRFQVRPGTHRIRTDDGSGSVVVTVGANQRRDVDLPLTPRRSFRGTLFRDVNLNGKRNAGEEVYAGVRVWLDIDEDGRLDANEPSAISAADGTFDVRPREMIYGAPIRYLGPSGKLKSTARRQRITLYQPTDTVASKFGLYAPTTLTVTAFLDLDRNRKWSKGDRWLAHTVAYIDLDNDGKQDKREPSLITDDLGRATFTELAAGTYTVRLRVSSKLNATRGTAFSATVIDGGTHAVTSAVRVG